MKPQTPTHAYAFQNGMLMVFDGSGNQVCKYQGHTVENLEKLKKDFPSCKVEGAVWDSRKLGKGAS